MFYIYFSFFCKDRSFVLIDLDKNIIKKRLKNQTIFQGYLRGYIPDLSLALVKLIQYEEIQMVCKHFGFKSGYVSSYLRYYNEKSYFKIISNLNCKTFTNLTNCSLSVM